jgi:OmpA-OmpF porin, OOP family
LIFSLKRLNLFTQNFNPKTFFMKPFLLLIIGGFLSSVQLTAQPPKAYTTKYDFVRGTKVLALEDFNNASLGDFPDQWNTNATGEIVAMQDKTGKWLKVNKEGVWHPSSIRILPGDFTLEFDLGVNPGWEGSSFVLNITSLTNPKDFRKYNHYVEWNGTHTIHLEFQPMLVDQRPGLSALVAGYDGNHEVNNTVEYKGWDNRGMNYAHISLWRQDKRLRVYLNGEKIWDIPQVFDPAAKYNAVTFANQGSYNLDDYFVISNVRLASGSSDTKNKIMKEGKFVTTGINFQTNSAEVTPDSYGVLKELASIFAESGAKIHIIGHTDADGDAQSNLELSKKRAAAVKSILVEQFNIPESNINTDGKGATAPIDVNTTATGKANNRRVEFVLSK